MVQGIDSLLIPPTNLTSTTTAFNLTSFQGALYQSSRLDNFTNTPSYTIFAPHNDAFQLLGSAISNLTVEELRAVMDFHVLPNQVAFSPTLANGTTWRTQQGGRLTVRRAGNNIFVNSAQLLSADILLANGVLHVLDNVLNPLAPGAAPSPELPTQVPVFAAASSAEGLPFTTAIPCTVSCPVTSTSGVVSGTPSVSRAATTSSVRTSRSQGVAGARETGLVAAGKAGLMIAIGGAVLML